MTGLFCDQLADILDQLVTAKQRFVVCRDFNCPGSGDRQLDANLDNLLHRYVQDTTRGSNTLDLLLTSASDTGLLSRVAVQPTCFSDYDLVTCRLHVSCNPPTVAKYQYRDICCIDIAAFQNDIL